MPLIPRANQFGSGPIAWLLGRPSAMESLTRARPFVLAGADPYRLNCQSCHGPEGAGSPPDVNSLIGRHAMMMSGSIPSLASMPAEQAFDEFVAKVREGVSPPMMMAGSSKMPKLPYLTSQELAAALVYLTASTGRVRPCAGRSHRPGGADTVKTRWAGAPYGVGRRMRIAHTRAMVRAAGPSAG